MSYLVCRIRRIPNTKYPIPNTDLIPRVDVVGPNLIALSMAKDFFVLDIGESQTKIADVHVSNGRFVADAIGMVETEDLFFKTDKESSLQKQGESIKKLIGQLKIKKKIVHIILPDAVTFSRFVEMPKLNEKELLSAIKYQADQFIPMPLEETNIDIEVVHENQKTSKLTVLISAAPKKLIQRVEDMVELIGLMPESIEAEISAIARLSGQLFKKSDAQTSQKPGVLLINVGLNSTTVYGLDQNDGILLYNHTFNIGLSLFVKEIQVNLNIDINKAFELLKSIGIAKNASYALDVILATALKDFLTEIQKAIGVLSSTYGLSVAGIFLFQEAHKFFELDKLVSKAFGANASFLDLYPYFEKNNMVDFYRLQLSSFISTIGGNLT